MGGVLLNSALWKPPSATRQKRKMEIMLASGRGEGIAIINEWQDTAIRFRMPNRSGGRMRTEHLEPDWKG